jgi:Raf kinase inhibitor-like YbhB/YbcL family protein
MQNLFAPQNLLRLAAIAFLGVAPFGFFPHAQAAPPSFQLSSTAFSSGQAIPKSFTCDGANISPQLSWTGAPSTTQSFALIMDDPDAPAGTWVHWVLYDVPFNTRELAENVPTRQELSDGTRQGRNDFNKLGYGGPCPPSGNAHRYLFKLYALDAKRLNLRLGASKTDLEHAIQGHILAQTELAGRYNR